MESDFCNNANLWRKKMKLMASLCFIGLVLILTIPIFGQSIDNRDYEVEVRDIHTRRFLIVHHNVEKRYIAVVQEMPMESGNKYSVVPIDQGMDRMLRIISGTSGRTIAFLRSRVYEPHTDIRNRRRTEYELSKLYKIERQMDYVCQKMGCAVHPRAKSQGAKKKRDWVWNDKYRNNKPKQPGDWVWNENRGWMKRPLTKAQIMEKHRAKWAVKAPPLKISNELRSKIENGKLSDKERTCFNFPESTPSFKYDFLVPLKRWKDGCKGYESPNRNLPTTSLRWFITTSGQVIRTAVSGRMKRSSDRRNRR